MAPGKEKPVFTTLEKLFKLYELKPNASAEDLYETLIDLPKNNYFMLFVISF